MQKFGKKRATGMLGSSNLDFAFAAAAWTFQGAMFRRIVFCEISENVESDSFRIDGVVFVEQIG